MTGKIVSDLTRIVILPKTTAGRELLRMALPVAHGPDRADGELPDGSSIYDTDFDVLAVEVEQTNREYEAWCREVDRDREAFERWCKEQEK